MNISTCQQLCCHLRTVTTKGHINRLLIPKSLRDPMCVAEALRLVSRNIFKLHATVVKTKPLTIFWNQSGTFCLTVRNCCTSFCDVCLQDASPLTSLPQSRNLSKQILAGAHGVGGPQDVRSKYQIKCKFWLKRVFLPS